MSGLTFVSLAIARMVRRWRRQLLEMDPVREHHWLGCVPAQRDPDVHDSDDCRRLMEAWDEYFQG